MEEGPPRDDREAAARESWLRQRLAELRHLPTLPGVHLTEEIERLQARLKRLQHESRRHDTWVTYQIVKHKDRPRTRDYIDAFIEGFEELKGDRLRADDPAMVGGVGWFDGRSVVVVGHQKGRTLNEQTERNFGMAKPEGYRKAVRLMELAERFNIPVITLIDTAGAYPGIGAEERGQAEAIARSTDCCLRIGVPLITVVIGEGGSGGAIAIASANRILMLEHAIYTVASPEAAASILWRDSAKAIDAATNMKITAQDLDQLGVIDVIITEPVGGAHRDREQIMKATGDAVARALSEFDGKSPAEIIQQRHDHFMEIGQSL
jgi:acetyl-CoA carboxylase carboxyl transferase subunit alpha